MTAGVSLQPLSREKKKVFSDLATASGRNRRGFFLVEGRRAIEDALYRGHRFPFVVVEAGQRDWVAAQASRLGDATIYEASSGEFRQLAQTSTPQGVLAIGRLPRTDIASLPDTEAGLTLLADGVRDPGNLGTLFRTLAAVGGTTALLAKGTVDPYNAKVLRAAAGAVLELSVASDLSRRDGIDWCRERGLPLIVLDAGAPDLFETELPDGPLAIAVGNETEGVSNEIREGAARVVGLPMAGEVDSLSVAVAGSIGLYSIALRLGRRGDA